MSRQTGPVVILDRDGTVVIDRHYLGDPDGLEFMPGAAAGLRKLHAMGCRLIIITNQSGIGRGILTVEQVKRVNTGLEMMMDTIGAPVIDTYFCPHAPDANCDCRKPATKLLLRAASEHDFDPSACIVIGDKQSDVEMGRRVGARTILVSSKATTQVNPNDADVVVSDLNNAAQWIKSQMPSPVAAVHPT